MPTIDPVFHAVVKTGTTSTALTITGVPNRKAAEAHLKSLGYEGATLEESAAVAEQKAAEANRVSGSGINSPANVNDVLPINPVV